MRDLSKFFLGTSTTCALADAQKLLKKAVKAAKKQWDRFEKRSVRMKKSFNKQPSNKSLFALRKETNPKKAKKNLNT